MIEKAFLRTSEIQKVVFNTRSMMLINKGIKTFETEEERTERIAFI